MPLSVGDKLGPYEILAPIGAGGMGEVYRAHDSRLNRDVAIKVSAAQFSERFEREAKAIAALNHPNICQVYDVGPNYLVMEFIEGESPKGPMPLDEALRIARQIADALEAAHEKGITHRDLKPGNIKIKPDGTVKVLDFGLAKIHVGPASSGQNSPTLTIGMTQAGMILGTAAYMAPEQARGKEMVDKRADIWAFGTVLYELLTGKQPFHGEDVGDILASVIKEQPNLDAVPPQVRPLLQKCLEKDPKNRLRDIGDAWLLLADKPAEAVGAVPASAPSASRRRWMWPIATAFAIVCAIGVSLIHFRDTPPEAPVTDSTLLAPEGYTFNSFNNFSLPAISPDGRKIVFGAGSQDGKVQLWLRLLDASAAQPLPGTESGASPFWSPDSRLVAFASDGKLKKIDTQGGPPVTIAELPAPLRGGSWNKDGVIILGFNSSGPLQKVAAAGGTLSPASAVDLNKDPNGHRLPWFLPDGRHFLYISPQANQESTVVIGSLDDPGKPSKIIGTSTSNVIYSQGRLLFLRENTLMAQPFDAKRLETTGEAAPIAERVPYYLQPSRGGAFTASENGFLVYQSGLDNENGSKLALLDRTGKELSSLGGPAIFGTGTLSPDQKTFAVQIAEGGRRNLWLYDVARGLRTRFTFDAIQDLGPVWSSDGSYIAFFSLRKNMELIRKPSNGTGKEDLLYTGTYFAFEPQSWSPDGKTILFRIGTPRTQDDIWALPLPSGPGGPGAKPFPVIEGPGNQRTAALSPDGKWIAYSSTEGGPPEVYVVPFSGSGTTGGKRQVSTQGGNRPRWRRDGKELFYTFGDQVWAAEVNVNGAAIEIGRVRKLIDVGSPISAFDVFADGQKFILARRTETATVAAQPLTLVQNWTLKLRK